MREAGLLTWEAHQVAKSMVRPGVATREIDAAVDQFLASRGAIPLFKGVPGPEGVPDFPAATCISVNEAVVHGMPGERVLREGDVVSIDIGVRLKGWCGDAAVAYPVGEVSDEARRLLEVTEGALRRAIELMGIKKRWSQVGKGIQTYIEDAGFTSVEALSGHSIGREMWDGLHAPNYWNDDLTRARDDWSLTPGIVVAVEPMVNVGAKDVETLEDGWTIVTADGSLSAHFEHTIALTKNGPLVLTCGPNGEGWAL